MTLPFGTRVTRISDPSRIGIIVGIGVRGLAGVQPYTVAWEGQRPMARQTWEFGDGLTVVESPDTIELRRLRLAIARLIRSFDEDDTRSMGTIDEDVQPIADAMLAWHKRQESAAESALREIGRMPDLPPDADPAAIVEALRLCVADKGRVIGRSTREDPPAPVEESVWGEP